MTDPTVARPKPRALALALMLLACGPTESDRVKTARAIENEQTPENLYVTGQHFAMIGDTSRAEEYLSAALDKGGDAKKILPLLLEVCVRDGRFQMAIEYARPYVDKHPRDTNVRYLLATLYAAVGDPKDAQREASAVVDERPSDAEPHFLLATVLRELKELVGADRQFREYLRLAPHGPHSDEAKAALLKEVPPPGSSGPSDGGAPTPIGPIPDPVVPEADGDAGKSATTLDGGAMMSLDSGKRK